MITDEFYSLLNEKWPDNDNNHVSFLEAIPDCSDEEKKLYRLLLRVMDYFRCFPLASAESLSKAEKCFENIQTSFVLSFDFSRLNSRIKLRLYLLLWVLDKDAGYIDKAVMEADAAFVLLRQSRKNKESINLLISLLTLTRSCGLKRDSSIFLREKIFDYIEKPLGSTDAETCLIEALSKEKDVNQKNRCLILLQSWGDDEHLAFSRNYTRWLELIVELKEKLKVSDIRGSYLRLADQYEMDAVSPEREGCVAPLYKKAYNCYKRAGVDREFLSIFEKKYTETESAEFHSIPLMRFEPSPEAWRYVDKIEKETENLDFEHTLEYVLSLFHVITEDDIKERIAEDKDNTSLFADIPYAVEHDNAPEIKYIKAINGAETEQDKESLVFFKFTQYVNDYSVFVSLFWNILCDKYTEESSLDSVFMNNPLFSDNYVEYLISVFRGLFRNAGFSAVISLYAVLPVIEGVFRELAVSFGDSVINTNNNTYQTLGNILNGSNLKAWLEPSWRFNLLALLTHDKGFHIRNSRLHGNSSSLEMLSSEEKYLVLFLMKIFWEVNRFNLDMAPCDKEK